MVGMSFPETLVWSCHRPLRLPLCLHQVVGCDDTKAACHLCVCNLLAKGAGNTQRGYEMCTSGFISQISPDQLC